MPSVRIQDVWEIKFYTASDIKRVTVYTELKFRCNPKGRVTASTSNQTALTAGNSVCLAPGKENPKFGQLVRGWVT